MDGWMENSAEKVLEEAAQIEWLCCRKLQLVFHLI